MVTQEEPWPEGTPAWAELVTPDLPASREFYAGVLGWDVVTVGQFDVDDNYGFGVVNGKPTAGLGAAASSRTATWTTYLAVESVADACYVFELNGGRVLSTPAPVGSQGR